MHRAGPGAILNARRPLRRYAAGTTVLALTALLLPPTAGAARPDPTPAVLDAGATSDAETLGAEEARNLALERADRANRSPTNQTAAEAPAPVAEPAQRQAPQATTAPPKQPATKAPPKKPATKAPPKKPSSGGTTVKPPSGAAGTVVSYAMAQVGKPYVYASSGPNGFDCSGLVKASYARVGISMPHQSERIAARGRRVPAGQAMPGDVMHTPGHVGIYIGNGKMVAATRPGVGVQVGPARGTAYRFL